MLLKEDQNTGLTNLKEIKAKKCVTDDFKFVTNPINNKVALYKKTEKGNWIFVYEDLTIEAINPSTKETLKTGKISCEGFKSVEQKKSDEEKLKSDEEKLKITADNKVVEDVLNKAGYTLVAPEITDGRYDKRMDIRLLMGGKYKDYYKDLGGTGGPIYAYPMEDETPENYSLKDRITRRPTDDSEITGKIDSKSAKKLLKRVKSGETSKKDCRSMIKTLDYLRKTNAQVDDAELMSLKRGVFACYEQGEKFIEGTLGVGDEMKNIIGDTSKYGINEFLTNKMNMKESTSIKSVIKENLIKKSIEKKNILISETTVIKNRYEVLTEGKSIKTEKEIREFVNELIKETAELNSLGYRPELIQEGLFDMVKGLFGNASESIFSYFKEQFATWIVEKFTPIESDSWLGSIIITAIGNVPISELPKLTNCSFVSNIISKSIVEGTTKKIQAERGFEGAGYDILRNALIEMAEDSSFGQKVEQKVSGFICPLLGGIGQKLGSAASTIKQKVMA